MPTKTADNTLNKAKSAIASAFRVPQRDELTEEVRRLRSLVVGLVGRDMEGAYRPEYVRRLLTLASKQSTHVFKDEKSFLKESFLDFSLKTTY